MSRQRFLLLLAVAIVALSAALLLSARRNRSHQAQGGALLPALAGDMHSVTAVILRKGGDVPVTVHRVGDRWTVAERGDYPADVSKLRTLLGTLRDARIVEEKTSNPQRYAEIGVEDPAPGSASNEVTVVMHGAAAPGSTAPAAPTAADSGASNSPAPNPDALGAAAGAAASGGTTGIAASNAPAPAGDGGDKYSVIVGKPVGEGSFVRRPGEQPSYSVEPAISVETAPQSWIDPRVLDVSAKQIQRIDAKPASGAAYALRRSSPADDTFALDGVPAGRSAAALAPPTLFANLTADDVLPAAAIDAAASSQVVVTLLDGNVITVTGVAAGDKHWIEVKSSKDSALTAKTAGRAFEVANYRYDPIFRPLEQLLVPKESPARPAPGASASAAKDAAKKSRAAKPTAAPAS